MSIDQTTKNGSSTIPSGAELARMIDNGEWDKAKEMLTPSPEEVEQMLQEPMIDAAEVNRRLGISDKEIAEALKAPPPEIFSLSKRGS